MKIKDKKGFDRAVRKLQSMKKDVFMHTLEFGDRKQISRMFKRRERLLKITKQFKRINIAK